ncbi:RluA family pseudouridine synthase [Paenibacillus massiliensis]|uniref:RluA family pseudouridine synthase n=1 Tax=Paenibacillus massiliensis TaxID=225917 RepID=UPI0003F6527E|nr:RluA family pseudouridine synthase [Paenibacillus massiliensis]
MSWRKSWKRRGPWLELTPGKEVTSSEDKHLAAERWIQGQLGMPEKLYRRLQHDKLFLLAGDRLRIQLFPELDYGVEPRWHELTVLYEDDFCLVVHKPAGMPVHPDGGAGDGPVTLDHAVASYYEMNGIRTPVRHIHRLDVDTTGPVLYAKNGFAQLKLDEQMRSKEIHRRYVAIGQGKVPKALVRIDEPIGKDRHHKQRRRVSTTGQEAVTLVQTEEYLQGATLVHLTLETGRTHQIRVHMSHVGHPLLGDVLYGGPSLQMRRQALHGEELTFQHPISGQEILVHDPWPSDFRELYDRLKL